MLDIHRGVPRGGRRHRRDRHLRRHAARPRRVRARRRAAREINRRGRRARARGGRCGIRTPGTAALRRRLDGPHHQGHLGHRRRHLRSSSSSITTSRPRACTRAAPTTSCSRPARTRATSRPALIGIERRFDRGLRAHARSRSPGTIEPMGTMLAGQAVEALVASLEHLDLLYIGPQLRHRPRVHDRPPAHARRAWPRTRVACVPNAGLPDEDGRYLETPEMLARDARALRDRGLAQPRRRLLRHDARAHRGAGARWRAGIEPRVPPHRRGAALVSGIDSLEIDDDTPPGDRRRAHQRDRLPQVQGADRRREDSTRRAEIAAAQVERGAQVIDVCLPDPDRDEVADMRALPRAG